MSWAKWDAEHPYERHPREGGKQSSADKLAEMIKSTVGNHEGTRTTHVSGSGGSIVKKTTKGDLKRPVQPKGHKDSGDSARTTIRMAAYYRGKRGEQVGPQGPIKPESGNTGKIRSADRLVSARESKPAERESVKGVSRGKEAEYERVSERAKTLSDSAKTADEHRAAADAHSQAGELSFGSRQGVHHKLSQNHAQQAALEDKMVASAAAREARKGQPRAKPTTYVAQHGDLTKTRTSPRPYTHAAVYRNHKGEAYIGSFHESHAGASRGSDGMKPIAVVPVHKQGEEPKAPARSADKLAAQAKSPEPSAERSRQHYEMVADRAKKASDVASTSHGHDIAAQMHQRAAELAPTENHRHVHTKLAENHAAQAENERKGEALAAERQKVEAAKKAEAERKRTAEQEAAKQRLASRSADMHAARIKQEQAAGGGVASKAPAKSSKTVAPLVSPTKTVSAKVPEDKPAGDYESARKKATSLGADAQTPEEHKAAAQAHREAAALAPTVAGRAVHNARVNHHVDQAAISSKPKSDTSSAAEKATAAAEANPTAENHKAAYQAHRDAFNDRNNQKGEPGTTLYHSGMATYHHNMATPANNHLKPDSDHAAASGYRDLESLQRSKEDYASVPGVKKSAATEDELASVKAYTRGSDEAINHHLRGAGRLSSNQAKNNTAPDIEHHASNLDSVFAKQEPLSHDLTTYRGVENADRLFGSVGSNVGGEFVDHGYSSTSTHADVAHGFGAMTPGGALIVVKTRKGTRVLNPVSAGAFGSHEKEVLLPRKSGYRIVSDRMVRTNAGHMQRQIHVEHSGPEGMKAADAQVAKDRAATIREAQGR